VLQLKKDEEEKRRREEEEERARLQREQEKLRKDRDREMRYKARLEEEVRALHGHITPHMACSAWCAACAGQHACARCVERREIGVLREAASLPGAQERLARQAEELRRKLAGIHPDGPSREERYQRRLQQIDNGEVPSRGKTCSPPMTPQEDWFVHAVSLLQPQHIITHVHWCCRLQ
jgi:hypothetical protein